MPDGATVSNTANAIADNFYPQVDSEGRQFLMLEADHRKDKTAYSNDDGYVVSHNSNKTLRQLLKVSNYLSNGRMEPWPGLRLRT